MNTKDFKFLMQNKKDISIDELTTLLLQNDLHSFDPVYEAFKAYDPRGLGYITKESLQKVCT
jgi:Ca2+-binding EF-hand superfamily protein